MIVDVVGEMEHALTNSVRAGGGMAELRAHGVSAETIGRGLVGVGKIRLTPSRSEWEPDPEGQTAYITPLFDDPEDPRDTIDLLAWHPATPRMWALRRGLGTILGWTGPQYMEPPPVRVWRTPLDWFRHDCVGIAPLCPAAWSDMLMIQTMIVEDEAHRRELLRMCQPPPRAQPTIEIG